MGVVGCSEGKASGSRRAVEPSSPPSASNSGAAVRRVSRTSRRCLDDADTGKLRAGVGETAARSDAHADHRMSGLPH